ncbi:FhaA domain-containing protein [Streptomyces sp. ODS28]|uniref:FhaA domain-containing protein n=1 Tax=Streptomyces sp. ODS28 TaxID=3136688 RepID=UPI0031EC66DD
MGEHGPREPGQSPVMRMIGTIEHTMERWTAAVWALVRRPRARPMELLTVLHRECEQHAMILGRGRILVPNHFVLELPDGSRDQLLRHEAELTARLAREVRRYAAEQHYIFAGPVTVDLHTPAGEDHPRYRIRSHIAAAPPVTCNDDLTRAMPQLSGTGGPYEAKGEA